MKPLFLGIMLVQSQHIGMGHREEFKNYVHSQLMADHSTEIIILFILTIFFIII